ncbi:MAG TPA: AMP-binding protein, partial [Terriglobales bacterium]|nr:AMP-binding protein [Terriglobales bacterium]
RGARVAIYLENGVEAALAIFAALKAGAVFLLVNPTTKPEKLGFVLNDCRATVLVTDLPRLTRLRESAVQLPYLRCLCLCGPGAAHVTEDAKRLLHLESATHDISLWSGLPRKRCIDIDLAALVYTSGSTGRPKGVMLTHLNMVSAANSITSYLENAPDDILLSVLPLSFDYGLYQLLMAFKFGGRLVLERSFAYPHAVLERLVQEKATGFPIVPTIAALLLQMDLGSYDLSRLRYITNTGAALPTHHIRRLRSFFPHARLYSMYGLTECKRVSYLPPDQVDVRPGSVGRGMPNEEVYIVDENGRRLGPGKTGELVVRGSNVMKGYWERPEETDRVLRPGPLPNEKVLYTGDLFTLDDEGFLYFVGRRDDIIKSRGEKVSPKEVEDVLYSLDGVQEAAVVGVPDAILGQAIKAVVTLRPGASLTESDVRRHCAQHLEDFMVPKFVEFQESLPKTSTGKINRRELAATLGAQP